MRLRIDPSNPNTFKRMVKEGRGKGRNGNYRPWLTVQDLSSRGESTRLQGWRSGDRLVHLFSRLERDFFFTVEWEPDVVDCREQFPLDMEVTQQIADKLNVDHPASPKTRRPVPMTTDLLITKRGADGRECDLARNVKPFVDMETQGTAHPKHVKRNWEKFWIEQAYWKRKQVPLAWVTERDFSLVLARNVQFVHSFRNPVSVFPSRQDEVNRIDAFLFTRVAAGKESLAKLTAECDAHCGLKPGQSLRVALHLVATRRWKVDFSVPFNPSYTISLCK